MFVRHGGGCPSSTRCRSWMRGRRRRLLTHREGRQGTGLMAGRGKAPRRNRFALVPIRLMPLKWRAASRERFWTGAFSWLAPLRSRRSYPQVVRRRALAEPHLSLAVSRLSRSAPARTSCSFLGWPLHPMFGKERSRRSLATDTIWSRSPDSPGHLHWLMRTPGPSSRPSQARSDDTLSRRGSFARR